MQGSMGGFTHTNANGCTHTQRHTLVGLSWHIAPRLSDSKRETILAPSSISSPGGLRQDRLNTIGCLLTGVRGGEDERKDNQMLITFLYWITSTLNQKSRFSFFLYQPRRGIECQGFRTGSNWVLCDLEHDDSLNSHLLTQTFLFFPLFTSEGPQKKDRKKIYFVNIKGQRTFGNQDRPSKRHPNRQNNSLLRSGAGNRS